MKRSLVAVLAIAALGFISTSVQAGGCPGNCNGNGVCDGGTNTCICNVGFVGAACDACAPDYYSYPVCTFCSAAVTCSGNGSCNVAGFCNCNSGWIGVDCSIPSCPGGCGNGVCSSPGVCDCFPGWTGPMCDQEVAVPAVSDWGLAILTLTGLIAGTLIYGGRPVVVQA